MAGRALKDDMWGIWDWRGTPGHVRIKYLITGGESCIYKWSLTHLSETCQSPPRHPKTSVHNWQIFRGQKNWRVTGAWLEGDQRESFQALEDIWRMPERYMLSLLRTVQTSASDLQMIFQCLLSANAGLQAKFHILRLLSSHWKIIFPLHRYV